MKNIFIKTALAVAVLCAPTAYAQESSGSDYTVMKWGGGIVAVAGTAFYFSQKEEADNCRKANSVSLNTPPTVDGGGRLIRQNSFIICTNQEKLDDRANLYAAAAVLGGVALIAGLYLDSQAVPFQVRAKPDGSIALERDGLSLAAKSDKVSLQKRWTF